MSAKIENFNACPHCGAPIYVKRDADKADATPETIRTCAPNCTFAGNVRR